jgi:hypothetical protein
MKVFPSIRIEGGLFGSDILDQLLAGDLPGQKPADFGLESRRNLTDEIAAVFADARALWGVFQNRLARLPDNDPATTPTRDAWMIPLLGLFGYELHYNQKAHDVDGLSFAVSHRAAEADDSPPIHIVGARQELGRLAPSGRPRLAPHSLVQEYLNRTEHVWGLVTNGQTLRLLRNSTFIRRQAYVDFDLQAILEEQRFQDFAVLYRLLHRTRFPRGLADGADCLLEKYYAFSVQQGGRVREHLREGVEQCIQVLADGFLGHPTNDYLRSEIKENRLTPDILYKQLLRLIYRFLFLLVAEDRGLISPDPVYREHYGIGRLRKLLDKRTAFTAYGDLWWGLRVLWNVFGDEKLASLLSLAPLNGELFTRQDLDECDLSNKDLLDGFWHLANYRESPSNPPRRVNYSALDVEEMGSVYESLLDFHPMVETDAAGRFRFRFVIGSERKTTGSYYTPPELVNELIQSALVPVLTEKLKAAPTPEEKERAILSLKVCDTACGSGHFLLAAARRLGKELARIRTDEDEPSPERVRECIRDVIAHCIYGVDKNPLAVDLCRVALWIEGHTEGKPLTFLDHRIRCGDSLIGVFDLASLKGGIPDEAFKPLEGDDKEIARAALRQNRFEKKEEPKLFKWDPEGELQEFRIHGRELDAIADDSPEHICLKKAAFEAQHKNPLWQREKIACDLWTAAFFQRLVPSQPMITSATVAEILEGRLVDGRLTAQADVLAMRQGFFHWPLEFPEVFADGGFDVVLGNPPFLGGLKIRGAFGEKYRNFLVMTYEPFGNRADLCSVFFRKDFNLLTKNGIMGSVATNTIGQGDSRESGLAIIINQEGAITFAHRFIKWPGVANVEINLISIRKGSFSFICKLDGKIVDFVSSRLDDEPEKNPRTLKQTKGKSFQGDILRGTGFILHKDEANRIISNNSKNMECIFPYLNGEDFNGNPYQEPDRYVICFHDWPLSKAVEFPELISILDARVKLDRLIVSENKENDKWWLFWRYRGDLRTATKMLRRVLARSRVSEIHAIDFVPNKWIFSDAIIIFAFDDNFHFALLQSSVHEAWVRRNASTMRTDVRYTPTDCFDTFPFPQNPTPGIKARADKIGATYHEHRRNIMLERQLGLTKTYNLFNNPVILDIDISRLREMHAEMDRAILACYRWEDIDTGHSFHKNERGQTRFTINPQARIEILRRLLVLNLEIAEKERAEMMNRSIKRGRLKNNEKERS